MSDYIIKEGIRTTGFQASYAVKWATVWANVFVDCMKCDQSIGIKHYGELVFTDEAFLNIARDRGWIVETGVKILCPKCAKQEETGA